MVTLYIGIADYEWFRYLSARADRTGLDALLKAVARREIGSLQWSNDARTLGIGASYAQRVVVETEPKRSGTKC
jgi:hypothetical protein